MRTLKLQTTRFFVHPAKELKLRVDSGMIQVQRISKDQKMN
jgi:hypothetical protein